MSDEPNYKSMFSGFSLKHLWLVFAGMSLLGCGEEGASDKRLLVKPFAGAYFNSWPFDHEYPFNPFSERCKVEANDDALTWRGETLQLSWNTRCHDGHDWAMPDDTPLFAAADGEVVFAGEDVPVSCGGKGEVRALMVRIRHSLFAENDYETLYVHLNRIDVSVGQTVSANQLIGLSGSTGCVSGPHLHFSVYQRDQASGGARVAVDPFGWSGAFLDPWATHLEGAASIFLWQHAQAPSGDYGTFELRE